jgi:hypothetical protein
MKGEMIDWPPVGVMRRGEPNGDEPFAALTCNGGGTTNNLGEPDPVGGVIG